MPPELGQLTQLTGLFLAGNALSGSVPAELGQLSNLTMVDVRYNQLDGDLPANLAGLPQSGYKYLHLGKRETTP
jgi:Leucine-rich repeat (LRR) protein